MFSRFWANCRRQKSFVGEDLCQRNRREEEASEIAALDAALSIFPGLDPGSLVEAAFRGRISLPARDILIEWLIALPDGVAPQQAAGVLLSKWRGHPRRLRDPQIGELLHLLAEVAWNGSLRVPQRGDKDLPSHRRAVLSGQ
jgi:hypothetical protein